MSAGLITAFTLCRWLGLFPPETDSKLARAMYRAYQVTFFAVVSTVSMSMTIQLFAAPDLTVLARTIDMWTLCWTGLYKWTCMAVRARQYSQFHWLLFDVQSQGARTYDGDSGPGSDRFTVDRLKSLKVVSHSYVLSGFVVVTFLTAGFTMTYPQGYYNTYTARVPRRAEFTTRRVVHKIERVRSTYCGCVTLSPIPTW